MTFKNWKIWLSQLPLSLKWFVILLLIRPLIDVFYFLKNISPILSPLYIVGVLTPILIGLSFLSRKFPKKYSSFLVDLNFGLWGVFVLINLFFLFFIKPYLGSFGDIIKLVTPVLLFFYLRHFVKSRVNLIGILQTVLYSALIPAFLLLYELTFEPINAEYLSHNRGGGERLQGGFADIMNYAIYISAALLIKGYFTLREIKKKNLTLKKNVILGLIILLCFLGLTGIKQTSSWMVAVFLIGLFLSFNLSSIKGFVLVLLFIPLLLIVGVNTYSEKIEPLVNKEVQVIDGDRDLSGSFNGRMGRWIKYFDIWADMPLASNFIGVATSGQKESFVMVSVGIHNEFVRILFLTGIIGFGLFLGFLFKLFRQVRNMSPPERFLIIGALGTFTLYSVSTTPLLYAPFVYYIFPIFAYAALPKLILKKEKGNG